MLSREQFLEEYRHEFGGMVLDAATAGASGQALSLLVRTILRKIDAKLGEIHARHIAPQQAPSARPPLAVVPKADASGNGSQQRKGTA